VKKVLKQLLLEEPIFPQPLDSFLLLTNSGFSNNFSIRNDTPKEILRMKWSCFIFSEAEC